MFLTSYMGLAAKRGSSCVFKQWDKSNGFICHSKNYDINILLYNEWKKLLLFMKYGISFWGGGHGYGLFVKERLFSR